MKTAKVAIMIIFFSLCAGLVYWRVTQKTDLQILAETGLKDDMIALYNKERASLITAKTGLEKQQIDLQGLYLAKKQAEARLSIERVKLWADLWIYGVAGLLFSACLSGLIVASGWHRAHVKRASVHTYRIGKHNEVVVHEKDLSIAAPIAMGLMNAESLKQINGGIDKALAIYQDVAKLQSKQFSHLAAQAALPVQAGNEVIDLPRPVPTFAELHARGEFQQGADLLIGFDEQGQPQRRSVTDIKAMSVAGWQGSGKTVSTGYLVACALLQYPGSVAHVIDPHSENKEGLGHLLRPFEQTGRVQVIGNFDLKAGVPKLIKHLDNTLDNRLTGKDKSNSLILLVVDELARLAKLDFFDVLVAFLERCTEETRKAGIVFVGSSQKWAARSFKGRADIRGCMPSMLMHKAKKSQAKFLMEDATPQEFQLLKRIKNPGTALLSTSCQSDPILVNIPYIVQNDILQVAKVLKEANGGNDHFVGVNKMPRENNLHVDDIGKKHILHVVSSQVSDPVSSLVSESETPECLKSETPLKTGETPDRTLILEFMMKNRKSREEMAKILGVSLSMVKEILSGRKKLTSERKSKLLEVENEND
jgi:hypothetical protein